MSPLPTMSTPSSRSGARRRPGVVPGAGLARVRGRAAAPAHRPAGTSRAARSGAVVEAAAGVTNGSAGPRPGRRCAAPAPGRRAPGSAGRTAPGEAVEVVDGLGRGGGGDVPPRVSAGPQDSAVSAAGAGEIGPGRAPGRGLDGVHGRPWPRNRRLADGGGHAGSMPLRGRQINAPRGSSVFHCAHNAGPRRRRRCRGGRVYHQSQTGGSDASSARRRARLALSAVALALVVRGTAMRFRGAGSPRAACLAVKMWMSGGSRSGIVQRAHAHEGNGRTGAGVVVPRRCGSAGSARCALALPLAEGVSTRSGRPRGSARGASRSSFKANAAPLSLAPAAVAAVHEQRRIMSR